MPKYLHCPYTQRNLCPRKSDRKLASAESEARKIHGHMYSKRNQVKEVQAERILFSVETATLPCAINEQVWPYQEKKNQIRKTRRALPENRGPV